MKFSKAYTVYPIELLSIKKEKDQVYTFEYSMPEGVTWSEGAHTHLALDRFDDEMGWWQKVNVRHFTIMSMPDENRVKITTRIKENCSDFKKVMKDSKPGDRYFLFKIGSRLTLKRDGQGITIITQGVGQATARPMVYEINRNAQGIEDVYVINIDSSLPNLFEDEWIDTKTRNKGFAYTFVKNREDFYKGLEARTSYLKGQGYYYIIGSDEFIIDVYRYLEDNGVEESSIILDKKPEFYEDLKREEMAAQV